MKKHTATPLRRVRRKHHTRFNTRSDSRIGGTTARTCTHRTHARDRHRACAYVLFNVSTRRRGGGAFSSLLFFNAAVDRNHQVDIVTWREYDV
jgi:hypothetical protein